MLGVYSIIDAVSILIHLIINHNVLIKKSQEDETTKSYRHFLYGVGVYMVVDCLCALFIMLNWVGPLLVLLPTVYMMMFGTVVLWNNYSVNYLKGSEKVKKAFDYFAVFFVLVAVALLVSNIFSNTIFRISKENGYETGSIRTVVFFLQTIIFFLSTVRAVGRSIITRGAERIRHLAIAWFGSTLVLSCILQMVFPLFPVYSIGYMVGCCILHSFVIEGEKEEQNGKVERYIRKLERLEQMFVSVSGDMYSGIIFVDVIDFKAVRVDISSDRFRHRDKGKWDVYLNELLGYVAVEDREKVYQELNVEALRKLVQGMSRTVTYKGIGIHEEGKQYHYSSTVKLSRLNDVPVAIIFTKNITKDIELQLEENNKLAEEWSKAENANKAKSSFLFNMSHDIRTPMSAIIGLTELLDKYQEDPQKRQEYLDKIRYSNEALLGVINNILDISEIESGEIKLDIKPWNVENFIQSVYFVFVDMMERKNIHYSKNVKLSTDAIYCDNNKLREIFINLLSNAYKYTPEGGKVSFDIEEKESSKKDEIILVWKVSDTGIGISEEFSKHLYDRYSRENGKDESVEGTGLGLNIVKNYVEKMNGKIEYVSAPGKGTTFTVTIPFMVASWDGSITDAKNDEKVSLDELPLKDKNIIIAEDNELNAQILEQMLEDAGASCIITKDGQECIDALESSADGQYDVILMDIQMPNVDGYEATRRIRKMQNRAKADIPVIVISANAYDKQIEEVRDIGINDYIPKPYNAIGLINIVNKYV